MSIKEDEKISSSTLYKGLFEFYRLLEQEMFFEAHELLEELWKRSKKDPNLKETTRVLKGFINAAIAFEHIKRDRPKSKRVAQRAFGAFLKYHNDIDSSRYKELFKPFAKEIQRVSKEFMRGV